MLYIVDNTATLLKTELAETANGTAELVGFFLQVLFTTSINGQIESLGSWIQLIQGCATIITFCLIGQHYIVLLYKKYFQK